MPRIHILEVLGTGKYGGAERQVLALAKALDHKRFKITVLFAFSGGAIARELDKLPHVDVICCSFKWGWSPRLYLFCRTMIRRQHIDIIHFHAYFLVLRMAMVSLGSWPLVYSEHGGTFHRGYKRERFTYRWSDIILRGFERIVAVSEPVAKELRHRLNVDSSKIVVIHNPVSIDDSALVQPRAHPIKPFRLGFMGRLHPVKGAELLPALASKIAEHASDMHLQIVGEGVLQEELRQSIQQAGLEEQVELCGLCNDLKSFYESIDVLIVLSPKESFGMVGAEALWMGVPVVAFDVPGIRDVASVGSMLVPFGELDLMVRALLKLRDDHGAYAQLSEQGFHHARTGFSPARFGRAYTDLYQSIYTNKS